MPTLEHEFPLDLLRHVPDLAARLLDYAADTPVPKFDHARCDAAEATTTAPAELRADAVIVLERSDGDKPDPVLAIVVECQNSHDATKRYTWPVYVTNIRARLRCPVVLLVLAPTATLASWCAEPIDAGGGYLTHRPLAMALAELRPTTEAEAREQPELTLISAVIRDERDPSALDMLLPAVKALEAKDSPLYTDYVLASLSAAARKYLEEQVKLSDYEFKTELIGRPYREGRAEGVAEGVRTALLQVLDARRIDIDADAHSRIASCTDTDQLRAWLCRAVTASSAEELFD